MAEQEIVERFIDTAERFCSLIEHHQSLTAWEFVRLCAPCLADLYGAAVPLSLFPAETDSDELVEDAISFGQSQALSRELGEKFGVIRWYWEVFGPREEDAPVVGDLGDDLADIYRDVKNGLVAFGKGPANEALWHWQFSFRFHWGDHVVDSLRVLHRMVCTSLETK